MSELKLEAFRCKDKLSAIIHLNQPYVIWPHCANNAANTQLISLCSILFDVIKIHSEVVFCVKSELNNQ